MFNVIFVSKFSRNNDFALAFKKAMAEKVAKAAKARAAADTARKRAAEAVRAAWKRLIAKVDNTKAINVTLSAREAGKIMKYFLVTGRKIAAVTKNDAGKASRVANFDFDLQLFAGDQDEFNYLEGFQFHMGSLEVRDDIFLDRWDDSRLIEEDMELDTPEADYAEGIFNYEGDACDAHR